MSKGSSECVTRIALDSCFEFVSHVAPIAGENELPAEPGQIQRDGDGRLALLHFAPRRWLIPAPNPALIARLINLDSQGKGALIDVEGKWQRLRVPNNEVRSTLGSSLNLGAVLRNRECAAVVVFDCPVIVALDVTNAHLWVASSYLESFMLNVSGGQSLAN